MIVINPFNVLIITVVILAVWFGLNYLSDRWRRPKVGPIIRTQKRAADDQLRKAVNRRKALDQFIVLATQERDELDQDILHLKKELGLHVG